MKQNFIRIIKQKSGVAIMSVMLFFMVMTLMIGALTISSEGNMRVSGVSAQNTAAYYAAEAGITLVVNDYQELMDDNSLTLSEFMAQINGIITAREASPRIDLSPNFGSEAYAEISFKDKFHDTNQKTFGFTIVSTGIVNDQSRTLETLVDLEYGSLTGDNQGFAIRHSVLVRNQLTTRNGALISLSPEFATQNPTAVPRIATFSTSNNRINLASGTTFNGKIELVQGAPNTVVTSSSRSKIDPDNKVVNTPFAQLDFGPIQSRAAEVPTSSQIPVIAGLTTTVSGNRVIQPSSSSTVANPYVIPGGSYFVNSITFNSTNVVIRADSDVFIVTNSLRLGSVTFIGTGEVTIYVKQGSSTFQFPSANGTTFGREINPHLLVVYIDRITPTPTLSVSNNSRIYGSFMFKNANITFNNNTVFGGYLMTEGANVTLSNNGEVTTTFYYVPLGSVILSNNAIVRGAIISNNATINNNARVYYDPNFTTNFPFSISSPVADNTPSDNTGIKVLRIHRTTEK